MRWLCGRGVGMTPLYNFLIRVLLVDDVLVE